MKTAPGPYPLIVTAAQLSTSSEFQFDGEAVCIPMVSSTGHGHASLKRVHYASGKFAVANIIAAVQLKDASSNSTKFLALYLQHYKDELIVTRMRGTANVSLSIAGLKTIPISLPLLEEQQRIVDLIGSLDEAIEAADGAVGASLLALEELRDDLIFGLPDRVLLSEVCSIQSTMVDPTSDENRILPHIGTERIVGVTGDLSGVVSAQEDGVTSGKYTFTPDDIVYAKVRPNLRKVCAPAMHGLCSADAYPLRPKIGVDKTFLKHVLQSRPFTEKAVVSSVRTGMPKINRADLFSIQVPMTSDENQRRIGTLLEGADAQRSEASKFVESLRTLRSELLTVLLSGEHEIPNSYGVDTTSQLEPAA